MHLLYGKVPYSTVFQFAMPTYEAKHQSFVCKIVYEDFDKLLGTVWLSGFSRIKTCIYL